MEGDSAIPPRYVPERGLRSQVRGPNGDPMMAGALLAGLSQLLASVEVEERPAPPERVEPPSLRAVG